MGTIGILVGRGYGARTRELMTGNVKIFSVKKYFKKYDFLEPVSVSPLQLFFLYPPFYALPSPVGRKICSIFFIFLKEKSFYLMLIFTIQ